MIDRPVTHDGARVRQNGDVTSIAAIGPSRVAAIVPAQPGPDVDPYEDGLEVEVVMEPTFVATPDEATGTTDAGDAGFDPARRQSWASSPTLLEAVAPSIAAGRAPGAGASGNAAVPTGFDSTPATSLGDPPRESHSSPFARAVAAYGGR